MQASRIAKSRSSPAFPHANPASLDHNHQNKLSGQRGQQQKKSLNQRGGKAHTNVKRKEGNGLDGTEETNWLLRTASSIAMSSLEEDGLGWLGKRESSTSLHDLQNVEGNDNDGSSSVYQNPKSISRGKDKEGGVQENPARLPPSLSRKSTYSRMHSGRTSRTVSKPGSRAMSRVSLSLPEEPSQAAPAAVVEEEDMIQGENAKAKKGIEPDWIFPEEIQRVEEELRDDREGVVHGDEEEHKGDEGGEEEDFNEAEMKKVVLGRVGGWVDWAVGWMGDSEGRREEEEDDDDESEDALPLEEVGEVVLGRKGRKTGDVGEMEGDTMIGDIFPPPPTAPGSVMSEGGGGTPAGRMWDDAKWLLSVARQVAFT